MANDITQRYLLLIKTLIEDGKVSSGKEFAQKIGVSPSSITEIDKGRMNVGLSALQKTVLSFPSVSLDWLINGIGDIFNSKTPKNATIQNGGEKGGKKGGIPKLQKTPPFEADKLEIETTAEMPLVTLAKAADLVAIPVTDVEAAAGAGATNADYFDTSEIMQLPASMLSSGAGERICITVAGESMAPTLPDGSRVVIRRLPHSDYSKIPNNHICVVTDRAGETYIKRIKNRMKAAGVLTLVSDNPNKRKYKPFDIDETEIHNIWVAELFITDSVVNCADFVSTDNEVAKLHEGLAELRAEVSKIAAKVEKSGK